MSTGVYAAPSVSGVSGTVTHGGSITITGSAFGAKGGADSNKPLLWADFESSINPTSLGVITAWDVTQNLTRQASAPQYGVSTNNVVGTFGTTHSFAISRTGGVATLYMSGKRRYTDTAQSSNLKFFRLWNDDGGDTVASTSNDGIILDELCFDGSRFQSVTLQMPDVWNQHEFLWRQSTSGSCGFGDATGNGYYEFIQDGSSVQLYNGDFPTQLPPVEYGSPSGNGLRVMDNFTDIGDMSGTSVYMDDLYVDNTFARIIIGNASTLAASTVREVQIPSAWADTSVTVTVNRGSFGATESAYLFVIDANNVASAGHSITFGAGGGDGTTSINESIPQGTRSFAPMINLFR